jgi:hypothetical protein
MSSKSELLCIATLAQPLFGEHRCDQIHLLGRRERREVVSIECVVIVFEPDDPDLHPAASQGSASALLRVGFALHAG